jgi:hypothetical protein
MHALLIFAILKVVVHILKLNVTTTMLALPIDVMPLVDAFTLLSAVMMQTPVPWTVATLILVVLMIT